MRPPPSSRRRLTLTLPPYAELEGPSGELIAALPSEPQARFHALPRSVIYRYLIGGLGGGKSHAGWQELITLALENREALSALGRATPLMYLCAAPSHDALMSGPWEHAVYWFDEVERINDFTLVRRQTISPQRREIRLVTGDVFRFVIAPGKHAGTNVQAWWYDEGDAKASDPMGGMRLLESRRRRLRGPYSAGIATSTIAGDRGMVAHWQERIAHGDRRYAIVVAPTRSNPGTGGQYAEQLAALMSDRERRQNLEGEVVADEGAVYGLEYDPHRSVIANWKAFVERRATEWYIGIDWGSHYHAVMIARSPEEDLDVVFDEVIMTDVQDEEFLAAVVRRGRAWGIEPEGWTAIYVDHNPRSSCYAAHRIWPGRVQDRRIRGETGDKENGIAIVRWRLLGGDGRRRLVFADRLRKSRESRRILRCLQNYRRIKRTIGGESVQTMDVNQASLWSHGCDALRSYCWQHYEDLYWRARLGQ